MYVFCSLETIVMIVYNRYMKDKEEYSDSDWNLSEPCFGCTSRMVVLLFSIPVNYGCINLLKS